MYLLDSNVFIEAKNRYYAFDICPGFWTWMDAVMVRGDVKSISKVRDELIKGNDELAEWVKKRDGLFLKVSAASTQEAYRQVIEAVQSGSYTQSAIAKFLEDADPWLIAQAMSMHATVITHEKSEPESKKKVFIPDLCKRFDVAYENTFEMLRRHSSSFILDPAYELS